MRSSRAPRRRTLPAVLASALLAAAALLVPALPAAAHDELIGADPSADAVLEELPAQITLSYSADVLTDAGATVIEVTDATGTSLTDGAPDVSGAEVTQALAGPASGTVTVAWRVVSSDGHPIDGEFAFAVPDSTPSPTATPASSATPTASATAAASEAASPAATPEVTIPLESDAPASPLPWFLLAVALVIVAGVLVYVFASRGPRNTAEGGGDGR